MKETAARLQPSLSPILAVNFVGTLGFSIVLPFLVFLVTKWGGNALVFGLIGATYSAFQLIGAPILGRWSDRFGRRRILLLSQLGTLVSWLVFVTAFFVPASVILEVDSGLLGRFTITLPLVVLFVARAADGLTGGNVSVANAYLADITDEADRSRNYGRMAIAGNLGFVLGPALAGGLGALAFGEILPVIAAMTISVVATLIIFFGLQDVDPCEIRGRPGDGNVRKVFGQEHKDCFELADGEGERRGDILGLSCIPAMLGIYFLVMLGFSFFYTAFPIHAATGLDWTVSETGSFFAALSLAMVVVQGPVLARASARFSDQSLMVAGSLVLSPGFACLMSGDTAVIYLGAVLIALGNGVMWPSVLSVLSIVAGDRHQGAVQGLAGSAGAIASIVGLVMGGVLYNLVGTAVFAVAAAVIVTVAATSLYVALRGPQSEPRGDMPAAQ